MQLVSLIDVKRCEGVTYCAIHKHANSEVQKPPTDDCVFRCRQSS